MDINAPILQQIKNSIWATDPGAILVLYGSYARGDNRPDSDIDILVLLDKEKVSFNDQKRIGTPLYHIELETGIIISPIIFSKRQWESNYSISPFYNNVVNEGKIL